MNNPNKDINETIKRTKRYWYVDGFAEIGIGILLIVIILFNTFAIGQARQPLTQILLSVIGLPVLILLGGRGVSWIVNKLKEKYTYPRTGYVSYPRRTGSQKWKRVLLSAIIAAAIGALTSFFGGTLPPILQYTFIALMIALAYIYIGYTLGLARFYLIAIATLSLLLFPLLLDLREETFYLLFFCGQGFLWIISGAVTLCNYLSSTQPGGEDAS